MNRPKNACCLLLVVALLPAAAWAQTAKITAVLLDVKCRASAGATWAPAKVGRVLGAGAQVRTGKRGKCEIKFSDGSLIRLSPLSDLTLVKIAGKDLSMGYGKLYARIVKGTTARIQGGTGVASIKGTVLEFDAGDMGAARERATNVLTIFDGLAELSGGGRTREVGRGTQARIGRDGTPGEVRQVPGEAFFSGTTDQWWQGFAPNTNLQSTPSSPAALAQRAEFQQSHSPAIGADGWYPLHNGTVVIDLQSTRVGTASVAHGQRRFSGQRLAALPLPAPDVALDVAPLTMLQTEPAKAFGKRFYGPTTRADIFALGSTDSSLAGVRVRPSAVWNDIYFELGGMAWARTDCEWRAEISEAFAKARPRWGDVTVGRQHFIMGPVNNSNLGALVGFDTADAVRWQPQLGAVRLDLGYVHDFLPLDQDHLRGYYTRLEGSIFRGTVGFNALHYDGIGTGVSMDFSFPVMAGKWDVYGEFGSDPADRSLETLGSYFPELYDRYDVDLFLEYAHREGQGSLLSARAYRKFEHNWTTVLSVLARPEDDTVVSLGVIKQFD